MQAEISKEEETARIVPSHGISLDLPGADAPPTRPAAVSHLYGSTQNHAGQHHAEITSTDHHRAMKVL